MTAPLSEKPQQPLALPPQVENDTPKPAPWYFACLCCYSSKKRPQNGDSTALSTKTKTAEQASKQLATFQATPSFSSPFIHSQELKLFDLSNHDVIARLRAQSIENELKVQESKKTEKPHDTTPQ